MNKDMKGMRKLAGNNDEYSVQVRNKLKGSSSSRRKLASKINAISRMGTKALQDNAIQLLSNEEELSLYNIRYALALCEREDLADRLKVELLGKLCDVHRTIFGSKNKNLNINIEFKKWLEEAKKKREDWLKKMKAEKEQKDG